MSGAPALLVGRAAARLGTGRPARRALAAAALVAAWEALAEAMGQGTLPTPVAVLLSGARLVVGGELPEDVLQSLVRVALGYAIAALLGAATGIAMGMSRRLDGWLHPVVELFRPVSPAALVPLVALWLGAGALGPIAIVAYAAVFPIVLNMAQGIRQLDATTLAAARTLGVGGPTTLLHVALPGAVPQLLVGLRLAAGNAWRAVILAELLVGARADQSSSGGFGILLYDLYAYRVDLAGVLACILFAGGVGLAIDHGLRALERRLTPWARGDGG